MNGLVVLQDAKEGRWLRFDRPEQIIMTTSLGEVRSLLAQVEQAVEERGLYAAGFLSYESAPAFDPALQTHRPTSLPLLWFGLYDRPRLITEPHGTQTYKLGEWRPTVSRDTYRKAIAAIRSQIAGGKTYQVNYTYRLKTQFEGQPWGLYLDLVRAQRSAYSAYMDIGPVSICSASPELFFDLEGSRLTSRPMKGTARRGRSPEEDREMAEWLHHSEKNRAENVMIVDMIRNDFGRIAEIGTVHVPHLFEVERYPTLWQMTSTVTAQTGASIVDIMTALFPCASITGAPKVSTMHIIADLETTPRGAYTGCIGYMAPGRQVQFNVAIRTVVVDKVVGTAEYGVGGGIVWDSNEEGEYEECQTKARILTERRPTFRLLESILWSPGDGFFLLDEHLERLADSALYFGFHLDLEALQSGLSDYSQSLHPEPHKIRLLLDRTGSIEIQAMPLGITPVGDEPLQVGLATEPVDANDIFLFHKTTFRKTYEHALASRPECDEVLLWNRQGQVTEACNANIVLRLDGEWITPAVDCGLLPGTYRRYLMSQGIIRESVVSLDDLARADNIYLINSVRKWREAILLPAHEAYHEKIIRRG